MTPGLLLISLHGGQTEIDELRLALVGDQDVGSLDVAVGDALLHRVLEPCGHAQHERHGLVGRDPGAELHEIAKVHPLDVFHDHVMAILLPPLIDDLNDVGMVQLHAGLGFLVEPIDGVGNLGESLAQHLDGQRCLGGDVLAAIDAREGSFRQVEEDLGIAEEETAGVTLLEPIDLPARERPFSQQHSKHRVGRAVVGVGPRVLELLARDQTEHRHLVNHHVRRRVRP